MKQLLLLVSVLVVFFLGSSIVATTNKDDVPGWHPGFIQFEVEQVSPPTNWIPPVKVDKADLETILVNTEHIISIARGRGNTSKTPRQSVLLDNGVELLVYGKYSEIVKLIRASWVGVGK